MRAESTMLEYIEKFEKIIYAAIIVMLMVVLVAAMFDLVVLLVKFLWEESPLLLEAKEMIALLGAFLLVLIGVELLDTIKAYFKENTIHVEIVVLLAIIAVSRKVLLIDPTGMTAFDYGFELISIGVIIIGLSAGYYLIKKAGIVISPDGIKKAE
ncbi:phosphate-starvation-inducible PsiE family protein [uncultured Methanoregula sp.]|uniref:phosphate-starvation-inducible PsiE family protein n=1 Tax=uncultured Methanoregula sp. TaxID=1005933 RepID=UPI002AAB39D3|nr:phosphate-starvation-inducible PsiE family protein [uncultured Methanoregula sp.]